MNLSQKIELPSISDELDYEYKTTNWLITTQNEPFLNPDEARRQLMETLYKQSDCCRQHKILKKSGSFAVPYNDEEKSYNGTGEYAFDWFPPLKQSDNDICMVVYIHGGYWQAVELQEASHWAIPIAEDGGIFVSLSYKLAPLEKIQNMPRKMCQGMQKIVKHTYERISSGGKIINLNISLVGHSAGVQLALEMISEASQDLKNNKWLSLLKNLILISGVYDLRSIIYTSINKALKLINTEEAWLISPIRHFMQNKVNTLLEYSLNWLIIWAQHDPPVLKMQSEVMLRFLNQALKNNDKKPFKVESFVAENADHFTSIMELFNGPNKSKILKKIMEFIKIE